MAKGAEKRGGMRRGWNVPSGSLLKTMSSCDLEALGSFCEIVLHTALNIEMSAVAPLGRPPQPQPIRQKVSDGGGDRPLVALCLFMFQGVTDRNRSAWWSAQYICR